MIDTYARRIVGWRASRTAHAGFVLDAMAQAVHDRRPAKAAGLVHHSDRGSQYLSIKYPERLAEAGIEPSVGSVGDSYDNALAETINGLFKAEVIHRRGPWRSFEAVEYATLEWPYGDASIAYRLTGRLVQQPPPARAHRQHPPRRSRSKLLRSSGNTRHGRVTKINQPPANPARFNQLRGSHRHHSHPHLVDLNESQHLGRAVWQPWQQDRQQTQQRQERTQPVDVFDAILVGQRSQ